MARRKMYGEKKFRFSMTLTATALAWLKRKEEELGASSASDAIERLARQEENNSESY